jgi:serine/threonine protein kinase
VLLDPTGQLKLADLGSAKRIGDTPGQRLMTEIGTQSYLPPEQVGGRGRNSAGDLWALGEFRVRLSCVKAWHVMHPRYTLDAP